MRSREVTYIKTIKGEYKGLSGYLDEDSHIIANKGDNVIVILWTQDCRKILTTLKHDEYEIIEPRGKNNE
jgi:hypothetical protein